MAMEKQMNSSVQGQKKNVPLFSFAIVSYNNYRYIFEAVDSVLQQTYPDIELLIANDGSSDFNQEELSAYIEGHKRENLVRVDIHNNETNLGTVKNIETVRQRATGDYIMYMAADDALYDETVLQRYADEFERLGEGAMVLSSRTAMCSMQLNQIMDCMPDAEGIRVIRDSTPAELFSRMSHTFTIPTTSTCYRTALYDMVGPYDTEYFIIEDASFFLRLSRIGIRVHWIDDMIGARHRDGGVSHSEPKKITETYRRYRYDEIRLFEKEIIPYQNRLLPDDLEKMKKRWEDVGNAYRATFPATVWHKLGVRLHPKLSKISDKLKNACRNLALPGTPEFFLLVLGVSCMVMSFVCFGVSCMMPEYRTALMCAKVMFPAGIALAALWGVQVLVYTLLYYVCRIIVVGLKITAKLAEQKLAKR